MMEKEFDAQAMMERARLVATEVRKGEMFPAIIGAIAGGIAGALIAAMIAGGRSRAARNDESANMGRASNRPGWSPRDVVQLVTVAAALVKQAQSWYQEQKR